MRSKQSDEWLHCLWKLWKQAILDCLVIAVIFLLFGCAHHTLYGKSASDIRAAIDECHQNKLSVLLFQRPDHTVYAIRCIPLASEIEHTVMVRPKTPINVLRPLFNSETILIEQQSVP